MLTQIAIIANFDRHKPPKPAVVKQPIDKPKTSTTTLTIRRASAVLAIVGFGGGMAYSEYERYSNLDTDGHDVAVAREKTEGPANARNTLYILGAVTFAF